MYIRFNNILVMVYFRPFIKLTGLKKLNWLEFPVWPKNCWGGWYNCDPELLEPVELPPLFAFNPEPLWPPVAWKNIDGSMKFGPLDCWDVLFPPLDPPIPLLLWKEGSRNFEGDIYWVSCCEVLPEVPEAALGFVSCCCALNWLPVPLLDEPEDEPEVDVFPDCLICLSTPVSDLKQSLALQNLGHTYTLYLNTARSYVSIPAQSTRTRV